MKNYKLFLFIGYFIIFTGVGMIVLSFPTSELGFFLLGGMFVIFGFSSVVLLMAVNLFFKDKELEIEKLREMGLNIVVCQNCLKENVLEDQYCIYCGESLGSDEDGIQEKHKA